MNKPIPWKMYKQQKALALEERGYLVGLGDPYSNWLHVGHMLSPLAESYLAAQLYFFQEPSSYGLDQGRISRLDLRRHDRLTCEDLFRGITARSTCLYAFDRGETQNSLATDQRAVRMYRDIVELLG